MRLKGIPAAQAGDAAVHKAKAKARRRAAL
jgi:hypothetical protein